MANEGAEILCPRTPSFWGMSDRVIVTSGLSKAYGIPGVRIGWMAGPAAVIEDCWSQHDYVTIGPNKLSDWVARTAVDRHPAALRIVRGYLQPLIDLSVDFVRRHQRRRVFRADSDPFFFTLNSWGAALIYFTARDLLAPSPAPNAAKDRERFTRSLLQMGNRALAPSERRSNTAKAPTVGRTAGRGRS